MRVRRSGSACSRHHEPSRRISMGERQTVSRVLNRFGAVLGAAGTASSTGHSSVYLSKPILCLPRSYTSSGAAFHAPSDQQALDCALSVLFQAMPVDEVDAERRIKAHLLHCTTLRASSTAPAWASLAGSWLHLDDRSRALLTRCSGVKRR